MKMKKKVIGFLILLAITVLGVMYSPDQKVFAAGTAVKICAVSYTDESVLVFNNSNTKIYYATESDASKGTWDVINVAGEPITVIDISWLSPNKENILVVKGDNDPTQERVIINKRPQKLEVSINYSQMEDPTLTDATVIGSLLNIMATEGTGLYPITFYNLQWKKGEDGHWMSTDTLTKGLLKSYLIKGTYIYFRIAPVDDVVDATKDLSKSAYLYAYTKPKFGDDTFGAITFGTDYPDGSEGCRSSNEVKLKITKQSSLPVTGIDGGDFALQIKYGKEYRVTINGGTTPTEWTQVTDKSVKSLPLKTMVNNSYDGLTDATAFPMLLIEIRDYATSKAAASKIVETHLKAQRQLSNAIILGPVPPATSIPDPNIYVAYNGSKNITVTIPTASKDKPYEYCVVKSGSTIDVAKASWTSITKSTAVNILSSKAVDFGTLYVRMKEIKYKKATGTSNAIDYELASTCQPFTIKYPSVPVATKTTYIYTKGYPTTIKITVTLNTAGKMPFETSLKYVKLGTKDVAVQSAIVTPAIVAGVIDPDEVYTMEIILKSTELDTMTNCTARALGIYYGNNTVDKTSSKLTIKSPTAASSLTATPAQGIGSGTTAVTVANALGSGNSFVYTIGATVVTGKNKEDTITGLAFTSGADIAITPVDQYLTIYEINTLSKNIVRYKSIQITSAYIKP